MVRINFSEDRISFIAAFAVLFLFWILVSSAVDAQHILVGVIAAFIVSHFSSDLLIGKSNDIPSLKAAPLFLFYLIHLGIEIVQANLKVARIVLDPRLPISPSIIKFKTRLKSDTAKATLANSITLTPGTLTIDIKGDTFYVHTLTKEDADEVKRWHMEERLLEVEDAA